MFAHFELKQCRDSQSFQTDIASSALKTAYETQHRCEIMQKYNNKSKYIWRPLKYICYHMPFSYLSILTQGYLIVF